MRRRAGRYELIEYRKAGAKDNGKPGERDYTKGYYAAYLLDLEGNNIECLYYQPWWLSMCPIYFPRLPPSQLFSLSSGGNTYQVTTKKSLHSCHRTIHVFSLQVLHSSTFSMIMKWNVLY
jgi:hypothetical protein